MSGPMLRTRLQREDGFTLIEILVVIVVLYTATTLLLAARRERAVAGHFDIIGQMRADVPTRSPVSTLAT